ncbi:MAG TPA: hypothetical protein VGF98_02260 [Candidatus Tumulicola sp.]
MTSTTAVADRRIRAGVHNQMADFTIVRDLRLTSISMVHATADATTNRNNKKRAIVRSSCDIRGSSGHVIDDPHPFAGALFDLRGEVQRHRLGTS